jgi:hypothetical protein
MTATEAHKHNLTHIRQTSEGKQYECSCGQMFTSFAKWEEHAEAKNAGMEEP